MPVLLFFCFFKKCRHQRGLWVIIGYAALSYVSSYVYNLFYGLFPRINPYERYFYGYLTALEYLSFSYFIFLQLKSKYLRNLIIYISIAFMVFLLFYIFFTRLHKVDSLSIGVETIVILIFCIFFLFEQINQPENLFIYYDYRFWIIIAFMFYLSGSFFIFIFSNQIPRDQIVQLWLLTALFYTLKNILFSVGILVLRPATFTKRP